MGGGGGGGGKVNKNIGFMQSDLGVIGSDVWGYVRVECSNQQRRAHVI